MLSIYLLLTGCSQQKLKVIPDNIDYSVINSSGDLLKSAQINKELKTADVIYLGEIHDNPDHHAAQMDIIKKLISMDRKPVIGFDFFSREQSSWLLNYVTASKHSFRPLKPGKEGTLLRHRLGWNDRDDWGYYFPFVEFAKQNELKVFGADMNQGIRIRMARAGLDEMLSIEKTYLPNEIGEDSENYKELIYEELKAGHCGMASDSLVKNCTKQSLYVTHSWLGRF